MFANTLVGALVIARPVYLLRLSAYEWAELPYALFFLMDAAGAFPAAGLAALILLIAQRQNLRQETLTLFFSGLFWLPPIRGFMSFMGMLADCT